MSENANCPACGNSMRQVTSLGPTYWSCDNCMGKPAPAQPDAEAVGQALHDLHERIGREVLVMLPTGSEFVGAGMSHPCDQNYFCLYVSFRPAKPTPGQIADELEKAWAENQLGAGNEKAILHKTLVAAVKALREMGK